MNKKILALTLVMLMLPILSIASVQAGKGGNKESYMVTLTTDVVTITDLKFIPNPVTPKRIKATWTLTVIDFTLKIGNDFYTPDGLAAEGQSMVAVDGDVSLVYVRETYTFDGLGTIEISINGKIYNYEQEDQYDISKINGWGTGHFKGIKITALGFGTGADKYHIGTIMGWPGLP